MRASANNLWLYLLRLLATFLSSIIWIFSASSTRRTALSWNYFYKLCSWRRNSKKSDKPWSCCQWPLACFLLSKNTLHHCFYASFNSQRGVNAYSDVWVRGFGPGLTRNLNKDLIQDLFLSGKGILKNENIILWATLTRLKKYESKGTNTLPVMLLEGNHWIFILPSLVDSPAFYTAGWKTPYVWTELN